MSSSATASPADEKVQTPISRSDTTHTDDSEETINAAAFLAAPHPLPQIAELALTPQVSRIPQAPATTRVTTTASTATLRLPEFEVDWTPSDSANPRNWSLYYKALVISTVSWGTLVVVMYSTSYTTGISQ